MPYADEEEQEIQIINSKMEKIEFKPMIDPKRHSSFRKMHNTAGWVLRFARK